ncbi:hypothetical protein CAEBREN_18309 [Caenorhabditis brenneri]|uniref:Uncharacterized protein n=1 Tax=Caenorhabditis brenneri TaxID=135651 RepID=G0MQK3_CAEBE|nr:hypothetical protein CAEBREN_18309 [Caenorhabditis brenneri]
MQVLFLLVLSVGVFVSFGTSQPAPAADFVVEAGKLSNDNVGSSNKAIDAAQKTLQAFREAIQSENFDALLKLALVFKEEDRKHAKMLFDVWQRVRIVVQSVRQSADNKIIVGVLFIIGEYKRTEDVVLVKNTDSPTGWIITRLLGKAKPPVKHRTMLPINRMINHTMFAN